jgi:hypothetical protein
MAKMDEPTTREFVRQMVREQQKQEAQRAKAQKNQSTPKKRSKKGKRPSFSEAWNSGPSVWDILTK